MPKITKPKGEPIYADGIHWRRRIGYRSGDRGNMQPGKLFIGLRHPDNGGEDE